MSQVKRQYQVLVVDDSPVYRKLVEHALPAETYSLRFARDGAEAIRLYQEHMPTMVITDWVLPDFSGIELCQRIRSDASRPYTYIIMMTSNNQKEHLVQGLEAGADDYLNKPFDPAEMLARMGVARRIIDLNRELQEKSQRMEQAALTDALTGLPNRRAIEEWASRQLCGSARHGFPLWLVLSDIDNFKSINDTYGHEAGDGILKAFGQALKKYTRGADMCGRLGGDEFVLVITYVESGQIEETVNRFRERVADLSFTFGEKNVRVTASFGVAGVPANAAVGYDELFRKVDQMLYEAKRAGRNRVSVCYPK
jgi:two-component system cell cycle response regulator